MDDENRCAELHPETKRSAQPLRCRLPEGHFGDHFDEYNTRWGRVKCWAVHPSTAGKAVQVTCWLKPGHSGPHMSALGTAWDPWDPRSPLRRALGEVEARMTELEKRVNDQLEALREEVAKRPPAMPAAGMVCGATWSPDPVRVQEYLCERMPNHGGWHLDDGANMLWRTDRTTFQPVHSDLAEPSARGRGPQT